MINPWLITKLAFRHAIEAAGVFRRHGLTNIERRWLAAREYTALLPLPRRADAHDAISVDLREALRAFHETRPLRDVTSIHTARFVVLESLDSHAPDYPWLVFSFVCDGNVRDVLEELVLDDHPRVASILQHVVGYAKAAERNAGLAFLERHRIRGHYMFRDSRQLDPRAEHLHPSVVEIKHALARRQQLRKFVIDHRDTKPELLRTAFLRALAPSDPLRLSP
ncbi:MAG: hypothetical protein ABW321_02620, partial [Polyangiales bacterium]